MTAPVAVLGLGSIGLRHAANLLAAGRRVRGFDPSPAARAECEAMGGDSVDTREAALEGAVAAVVASPNRFHREDLAMAIDAGLPVLVEKPLAHTAAGMGKLLDRARAKGLVVFVGHNMRYHPAIRAGRDLLPRLGTPLWARMISASYLPEWRPGRDHRTNYTADPRTGGILFDLVHEFDTANFLLGGAQVIAASARCTGAVGIPSDDCADILLQHGGGMVTNIHMNYVTRPRRRFIEIGCTEGLLYINIRERRIKAWDATGALLVEHELGGAPADDYVAEMADFLACICGRSQPQCTGDQALEILHQVLDARRLAGLEGEDQ